MSVESVLARVATLEQALANPASLLATATRTGGTAAPTATGAEPTAPAGSPSFAEVLQSASAGTPTTAVPTASTAEVDAPTLGVLGTPGAVGTTGLDTLAPTQGLTGVTGSVGQQIVRIAESQLGQTEQPPGSNESPAIAAYRTATAGAAPGAPWCAYFASWAARQAGEPLGANGEGLGSAAQVWSWAQSTGRAIPNDPGVTPQPGDLIVFGDEHVGIVREVLPNGDVATIEGNYENKVAANVRTPTEATGYVNMN
jgi:CHAP domain